MYEYVKLKCKLLKAEAKYNKKTNELKAKFEEETAEDVKELKVKEAEIEKICKKSHKDFGDRRSIETKYGSVGFRSTPLRVEMVEGVSKWDVVVERVKQIFGMKYIRRQPEIDKERIKADYKENKVKKEELEKAGIKIEQGETFYIKVKAEMIK